MELNKTTLKEWITSKEFLFSLGALVILVGMIGTVFISFRFVIKNVNQALKTKVSIPRVMKFDIEGFKKLNLIKQTPAPTVPLNEPRVTTTPNPTE